MPAHLRRIERPKCGNHLCTAPATYTLHNTRNAPINHYCDRHADQALRAFKKREGES